MKISCLNRRAGEDQKRDQEERGLTGYMNATKWRELLKEMGTNLRDIPFMYKTLFDENEPEDFWSLAGDEYIERINTAVIEWMKIKVLTKYNIPYEHSENEKVYIVYGYK